MNDFAVFILTHGRPDNVITYDTLQKQGYTGKTYIIIDDEDSTSEGYYKNFGDQVIMFNKQKYFDEVDMFDNFDSKKAIVFARNACFDIAEDLGVTYFLQLDDDYTDFSYRLFVEGSSIHKKIAVNLNEVFQSTLDYYKSIDVLSVAYAQGGDFIGGLDNGTDRIYRFNKRKAMNTFFCSTERRFQFTGKINEDVNTYIGHQSKGNVFLTICCVSINQKTTQAQGGGMSDIYSNVGTYVKSFYTVICSPSSVKVAQMRSRHARLHHSIKWVNAVPLIISDKYKKY